MTSYRRPNVFFESAALFRLSLEALGGFFRSRLTPSDVERVKNALLEVAMTRLHDAFFSSTYSTERAPFATQLTFVHIPPDVLPLLRPRLIERLQPLLAASLNRHVARVSKAPVSVEASIQHGRLVLSFSAAP